MNVEPRRRGLPWGGDLVKYVLALLTVVVGVAAFIYGGADDSPGLQLIGALIVVGVVVSGARSARRGG
ncbi:hypothetical protein [Saccharothrix lopnurensis]|uniref:Uncharacterized protein n=1 Tax=Saccharothrix lopnurensis TaxID=1670621 RepID=A0ABW1PBR6_9PSEU